MDKTSFNVTFDDSYNLSEPTRTGYDFIGYIDEKGKSFSSSAIYKIVGNTTLTAQWQARQDTQYKINYYLEGFESGKYTLDASETKSGTSDSKITVLAKEYEGFTPIKDSQTVTIKADGSLAVDFY